MATQKFFVDEFFVAFRARMYATSMDAHVLGQIFLLVKTLLANWANVIALLW